MAKEFKVDQRVVYPLQGVGQITEISNRMYRGKKTPYYTIYIESSDMIVMIPVENVDKIGIRGIISKKKAQSTLDNMSMPEEPSTSDWKERYNRNLEKIKTGNVDEIAEVIGALYRRSKTKVLPIMERKLFDNALRLLVDELSLALKIDKEEVSRQIYTNMEAE